MGILVRLVTSMVGAVGGFALSLGIAWMIATVVGMKCCELFGNPTTDYGPPFATPVMLAGELVGVAISLACGYVGAAKGYRGGLAVGREICAANGPEQHSRIDVNHNHTRVS